MVLVIGANNFLGLQLISKLLKHNDFVKVLISPNEKIYPCIKSNNRIIKQKCNLNNFYSVCEAMKGINFIYNLYSCNNKYIVNNDIINTSINCVKNIVNSALLNGIKKMVHVSSVAALSGSFYKECVDESASCEYPNKNNLYAINYYESDREVFRVMQEGLNVIVVYPSLFKENSKVVNKIAGCSPYNFIKNIIISLTCINDFVDKIIYLCNSDIKIDTFIINDQNILINDLQKISIGINKDNFFKKIINNAFCIYQKNKFIINSELSFWLNNSNYYSSDKLAKCLI